MMKKSRAHDDVTSSSSSQLIVNDGTLRFMMNVTRTEAKRNGTRRFLSEKDIYFENFDFSSIVKVFY